MIDKGHDKSCFIPVSVLDKCAGKIPIINRETCSDYEDMKPHNAMDIRVLTTVTELMSIKAEWDALLKNSGNDIINLTHDWVMAWWNNFGDPQSLFIMVAYNASQKIVGIAPCIKVKSSYRGIPARKITLMANGYSPSADIISRKDQKE